MCWDKPIIVAGSSEIKQASAGYRYSLDPFLLADFVPPVAARHIIDIGTGNGILPRLLHRIFPEAMFLGLDIQPEPLSHAGENCANIPKALFIRADARDCRMTLKPGRFDLAVSNPPFRRAGSGRLNPAEGKAVARHEVALTLEQLTRAAFHVLKERGLFCLVHLAERSAEVMNALVSNGFAPQTARFVQSRAQENAFLILASAVKNGANPVAVRPPLVIHGDNGEYSKEMSAIYKRFDA